MRFKVKLGIILALLSNTATTTFGSRITQARTTRISGSSKLYTQDEPLKTNNAGYNESRIYNGDVVQENDPHYTFMVAIVIVERNGNVGVTCGGSLINERWVLTAGHCINDDFRQAIRDGRVVCWIGAYNVGVQENSDFRAQIAVQRLVEHTPRYIGKRLNEKEDQRNDIALLRLEHPVDTSRFKPICIGNSYYESGGVTLLGWGRYNGFNTPNLLNRANGDIANLQECKNLYGRDLVHNTMICARLHNNQNGHAEQAKGDSGGPLFFSPNSGRYIQVGIVSFNINMNKINEKDPDEPLIPDTRFPGVYTRTYSFIKFIQNTIQQSDRNLNIETCTR